MSECRYSVTLRRQRSQVRILTGAPYISINTALLFTASGDCTLLVDRVVAMGQRANFMIKSDSRWSFYYDHSAAGSMEYCLIWGPEESLFLIEQTRPVKQLMDEVWCEGAALMDLDEDMLLFFGGESIYYDSWEQEAFIELLRAQWPGWRISWAHEGIVSCAP